MVVVSVSGATGVGELAGTEVVIFGPGAGVTVVGQFSGTVVVVRISAGVTVVVGGCWNRCRVNRSRRIDRDASGIIGRDDSSCYRFQ